MKILIVLLSLISLVNIGKKSKTEKEFQPNTITTSNACFTIVRLNSNDKLTD